ncbi:hypothetical protein F511_07571 [Dorcoceras hygrometricum]|uniref:Uncharacterized protein n=1 Tax=Dorcoceras hygrometricum TaxID=472368 RepID=A0A2Z7D3G5_9LAMI|nr:hypothetical protein F511_07571 [Dorcoceras hygrometricum]
MPFNSKLSEFLNLISSNSHSISLLTLVKSFNSFFIQEQASFNISNSLSLSILLALFSSPSTFKTWLSGILWRPIFLIRKTGIVMVEFSSGNSINHLKLTATLLATFICVAAASCIPLKIEFLPFPLSEESLISIVGLSNGTKPNESESKLVSVLEPQVLSSDCECEKVDLRREKDPSCGLK